MKPLRAWSRSALTHVVGALAIGALGCSSNKGDARESTFPAAHDAAPIGTDAAMGSGGATADGGLIGPLAGSSPDSGDIDATNDVPEPIPVCGDGQKNRAQEVCDDGNRTGGDGCTAECDQIEADYVCPTPGLSCVYTVRCGDNLIRGLEQCDDGNTAAGDGCSANCQVEPGWVCELGSRCRAAACGDGVLAGPEQCDDNNVIDADGCSATCSIEGAPNGEPNAWQCLIPGTPCTRTTCGNGVVEGSEQCDDGNNSPFDGCSWNCTKEPTCGYDTQMRYGCTPVCGDGMVFPGEDCDDGNARDGDGCSNDCHVEPGYTCTSTRPVLPDPLYMPVVYRDFTPLHPQFEVSPVNGRRQPGIALSALDRLTGKPQYNPAYLGVDANNVSLGRPWTMDGPAEDAAGTTITDAQNRVFRTKTSSNAASLLNAAQIQASYAQWYTDSVSSQKFQNLLALGVIAPGTYQFDRSSSNANPLLSSFFPLDGLGFGNITATTGGTTYNHNYHFTSEVRYWFEFQGGERLEFRGDDDVWVFVNGQLSVDLGGIHSELRGVVTLNPTNGVFCVDDVPCAGAACTIDPINCATSTFNLAQGNVYEIVVFQAERHITASNYKLTLSSFNVPKSVCRPVCGDGIVVGNEACDLGAARNTGEYGACTPNCTLGPRCGDGVTQSDFGEQCDDGVNVSLYGGCAPGCVRGPSCGDGIVQGNYGEQCDDGVNDGGYRECAPNCRYGDRCGDNVIQLPFEQCDNGPANGIGECHVDCTNSMVK
jgi:fibro-slime domain-containing protein